MLMREYKIPFAEKVRQQSSFVLSDFHQKLSLENGSGAYKLRNLILQNGLLNLHDMNDDYNPLKLLQEQKRQKEGVKQENTAVELNEYKIRRIPVQNDRLNAEGSGKKEKATREEAKVEDKSRLPVVTDKFMDMIKSIGDKGKDLVTAAFLQKVDLSRDSSYASCVDNLPEDVYETRDSGVQTSASNMKQFFGDTIRPMPQKATTRTSDLNNSELNEIIHLQQQKLRKLELIIDARKGVPEKSKKFARPAHQSRANRNQTELDESSSVSSADRSRIVERWLSAQSNLNLPAESSNHHDYVLFDVNGKTATPFNMQTHDVKEEMKRNADEPKKKYRKPEQVQSKQNFGQEQIQAKRSYRLEKATKESRPLRDVMAKLKVTNDEIVSQIGGDLQVDEDIRKLF